MTGAGARATVRTPPAITLAPDVPGVQAIKLALDYRAAVLARDETARSKIADAAKTLLVTLPDNKIARRIVIDRLISGPDQMQALPEIDAALQLDPAALEYHMLKFRLLAQANDVKGAGDELKQMVDLFPDNTEVRGALIGWYAAANRDMFLSLNVIAQRDFLTGVGNTRAYEASIQHESPRRLCTKIITVGMPARETSAAS